MQLSRRVSGLKPSITVAFTNRAKQMRREGKDVLIFAAGEPDFDTPKAIKEAAKTALDAGQTKYVPTLGDPETREAIARKLTEENGIPGLTGDHVAISAGGKHGLYVAMHCLLDPPNPGEEPWEVLLPAPTWVSYKPIAELAGGRVVEIPAGPEADFRATADQIAAAITPRSRLLVLCTPSNPCGTQYPEADLRAIAKVVAEKAATVAPDLLIFVDEMYEKIVYGGIEHFSIGSIPEVAERTITLNGLSKAFAMTGWRIGYTAMPGAFGKTFIKAMGTLQGQMTTNITSFNYAAIRCALTDSGVKGEVERMRKAFGERAELMHKLLSDIPGIRCPRPTGAFYVFPDVSALYGTTSPGGKPIKSALDLCEALLVEAGVALVPGADFGGCGPDCARLSFACDEATIKEGVKRLADFVSKLKR
ncbi:MAG: aspartate aminotransferase [Phycisphaerae bacterium]|nr:aspartate aminotransferase [Phycisphaerae bacterium]